MSEATSARAALEFNEKLSRESKPRFWTRPKRIAAAVVVAAVWAGWYVFLYSGQTPFWVGLVAVVFLFVLPFALALASAFKLGKVRPAARQDPYSEPSIRLGWRWWFAMSAVLAPQLLSFVAESSIVWFGLIVFVYSAIAFSTWAAHESWSTSDR